MRDAPAGVLHAASQRLLRAGFVHLVGGDHFAYLPLGQRTLKRITALACQTLEALGSQEISLPAASHIGDVAKGVIRSQRQLPRSAFEFQVEPQAGGRLRDGLLGARQSPVLRVFVLAGDQAELVQQLDAHEAALQRWLRACGLPTRPVLGLSPQGKIAQGLGYLTPEGSAPFLYCDACGYAAAQPIAGFRKPPAPDEPAQPLVEVATPGANTIEALARFLDVPKARTAKAVFLSAQMDDGEERLIFAVIRGDMDVSEAKLRIALGARHLRPASEAAIRAAGAEPGYASPIGLGADRVLIVADDAIPNSPNLVAGANRPGYHLRNTNYGRDYTAHLVTDIALARVGDACPRCGAPMRAAEAVQLLWRASFDLEDAMFSAADGAARKLALGLIQVNLGHVLVCIADAHHDEHGLRWPVEVAPYAVHLVRLGGAGEEAAASADALYDALWAAGVETLYDDRAESPGVKFADADLIGLPLRITVAPRALAAGGVEFKRRDEAQKAIVPLAEAAVRARQVLDELRAAQRCATAR
ncbi:MAG: proline--tRNA ligase [Chloroflexi bacterium]|jgi:prolyl-tRNA synthetase|nr:proline--tRNA ligase [Chloroflexota bacterium]